MQTSLPQIATGWKCLSDSAVPEEKVLGTCVIAKHLNDTEHDKRVNSVLVNEFNIGSGQEGQKCYSIVDLTCSKDKLSCCSLCLDF